MEHRWPDAIAEARTITRSQAAYVIVRRIFETAGFSSERSVSRILGIDQALVESAARKLEREGVIVRGVRIDGHPGAISILSSFAG
jgi:DNA-binding transcriptional MocR family regulator